MLATGSFIGEGFDDQARHTAVGGPGVVAGTLAQYVGRLHRLHPAKRDVWIFDYVDGDVPVLSRMFERRRADYRDLGYTEDQPPHDFELMAEADWDDECWDDDLADAGA